MEIHNNLFFSHFEDLIMVKNVLEQVELLQKYSNFMYLNWASQKLVDYDGDKPDPPSSYLKILLERSMVQCDRMCDLIFGEKNPDHLIGTFLKVLLHVVVAMSNTKHHKSICKDC